MPDAPAFAQIPLVLPGSPALSADLHRRQQSAIPAVGAGVLALAIAALAIWKLPEVEEDARPTMTVASGPQTAETNGNSDGTAASASLNIDSRAAELVDSLAAFSRAELTSTPPSATTEPAPPIMDFSTTTRPSVLELTPIVSRSLRMGEQVQLRWSVRSPRGVKTPGVSFTSANATIASVDARTGKIMARAPGRVRIIVDAGMAGTRSVTLDVRDPASPVDVSLPPDAGIDAARAILITPRINFEAQQVTKSQFAAPRGTPAVSSSGSAVPASRPTQAESTSDGARGDLPTSADVRIVAERFATSVRSGSVRNVDVTNFLDNGTDHRVTVERTPVTTSVTAYSVRVTFTIRLTKNDGGGILVTRIAPITMEVDKRDRVLRSSAVTIGAMRRP